MNKKGATGDFTKSPIFWIIVLTIIVAVIIFAIPYLSTLFSDNIAAEKAKGISGFNDIISSSSGASIALLNIADIVFGKIPNSLLDQTTSDVGAVVIAIAVWFLIFLTFGDIIATFGTFNFGISWAIGFLLAVISANLQLTTNMTLFASSIFISLGLVGLFLGLGSAFVAFILVNFGVRSAKPWLIERRALMQAATGKVGAVRTGAAIEHLGDVEESFEESGKKKT